MEKEYKILLTEDDENLGMLLREYLIAKGYETDLMPDGEAGYAAFMSKKYDVCIFDVMMPKKDGFTSGQRHQNGEYRSPHHLFNRQIDEGRHFSGIQNRCR
jgi:DNA-binding response OmpR family regulator